MHCWKAIGFPDQQSLNIDPMGLFGKKKKETELPGWNELDIVLLGVGGAPSSGKTVLIDSLFRFMGDFRPDYLDGSNLVDHTRIELREVDNVYERNPLTGYYNEIRSLNSLVSSYFHRKGIQTVDNGIFDENTYKAILLEKGKPKMVILVRNISGEMFNIYFSLELGPTTLSKSLNEHFDKFEKLSGRHSVDFKNPAGFSADNSVADQFIAYLRTNEPRFTDLETYRDPIRSYFFAYLFFRSCNNFIYCLDYSDENDDAAVNVNIDNANRAIEEIGKVGSSFYVVTKLDKFFSTNKLLCNEELNYAPAKEYELLRTPVLNSIENYWTAMRYIYKNIYGNGSANGSDVSKLLTERGMDTITHLKQNTIPTRASRVPVGAYEKDNVFYSSATFHNFKSCFIAIQPDYSPADRTDTTYWHAHINKARTSIGVLELWLRLLHDNKFDLNGLKILPGGKHDNDVILKKIIGINIIEG